MHDGVVVIRHAQSLGGVCALELSRVPSQLAPVDADVAVSVKPHLLMPQAQRMTDLVNRHTKLNNKMTPFKHMLCRIYELSQAGRLFMFDVIKLCVTVTCLLHAAKCD